jgi:hypothetical protein
MLKEMEQQVIQIRQNLKIAHDKQKTYEDMKCNTLVSPSL